MRYIEDLKEEERLIEHYLCKVKRSMRSKNGKAYYSLVLQDKTGSIDAKIWDVTNDIGPFEEDDFVKIDSMVTLYQGELQLKIVKIRKSQEGEYQPMDYIPCTKGDIPTMCDEVLGLISSVGNSYMRRLLEDILINDEEISRAFRSHSAAKSMHHNYFGGLLEHTLAVANLCSFLASRYRGANRDILITAALLHDIAKIYELSPFPTNNYTDEGRLIGHVVMGAQLIAERTARIEGFPKALSAMIQHCILSHHGEYEFGSPKLPQTIEAFILHVADNADAKIKVFEDTLDNSSADTWVGIEKSMFKRDLRRSSFGEKTYVAEEKE